MRFYLLFSLLCHSISAATVQGTVSGPTTPLSRITLTSQMQDYSVPVLATGTWSIPDVKPGEYRLVLSSLAQSAASYRVIVSPSRSSSSSSSELEPVERDEQESVVFYRHTLGETLHAARRLSGTTLHVKILGAKEYYVPRGSLDPMALLKNPMVWIGLVMVFSIFVLPKLTQYLDPEGLEEMQRIKVERASEAKRQPAVENPVEKLQNFDVSGWLAGKK